MDYGPWSAANVADACLKLGVDYHCPAGLRAAVAGTRVAGPALPVRHAGSVDVFLEAIGRAQPGDVLLVDNGARRDEGCIGDLVTLEAQLAGIAGIIIWGCHRDQREIEDIGLPVFSLGHCPSGPRGADGRQPALGEAVIDGFRAAAGSLVIGDDDGVILVSATDSAVLAEAAAIRSLEERQADAMRTGRSIREQLAFESYLEQRAADPSTSFRDHLSRIGGAVET
jgi:regulator of RNase E activity RraA